LFIKKQKKFLIKIFLWKIQRIVIGHEGLGNINDWYLKNLKVQMLTQQQEFVLIVSSFLKKYLFLYLDILSING
jgi:hypothetical protein